MTRKYGNLTNDEVYKEYHRALCDADELECAYAGYEDIASYDEYDGQLNIIYDEILELSREASIREIDLS